MESINHAPMLGRTGQLPKLLWAFLGLMLVGYGLLAFNAGTKVSPLLSDGPKSAAMVEDIMAKADQGIPMENSEEAEAVLPFWINLIARIESSKYVHGSDSIMDAERHYQVMPETKRNALSTHMMLGLVLMTTGFFQFWPAFRRKHRKAHRIMGASYMLAAFTSMGLSSYYLINTKVADIYSQFIFYFALWTLVVISLTSLSMAGWTIFKRNIAAHLGWQALAFGCFLTAPVERLLWIGLAPLSNGASFNEMNILVNVVLIPLCFLGAFSLFYANRASSPLRAAPINGTSVSAAGRAAWIFLAVAAWGLTAIFYMDGGLSANEATRRVAMSVGAQVHDAAVLGPTAYAVCALIGVILVCGLRLLLADSARILERTLETYVLATSAGVVAIILLAWGFEIGMPTHEKAVAGVAYAGNGALLLVWIVCGTRHFLAGAAGKFRETVWFVLLLGTSPALMYAAMFVINAIGLVPAPYDGQGHGYQIAAALGLIVPMLVGHLLAVHSPETRRYAIN